MGAVTERPGPGTDSAVCSVVVLFAGSRSRQVTSPALIPAGRLVRPPPVTVVAREPFGSSCRTMVSTGAVPALRTSIR